MADRPSERRSLHPPERTTARVPSGAPEGGGTAAGLKSRDVEQLVAAERAMRLAGEEAAAWWQEMAVSAASARTDGALDALYRTALATIRAALGADVVSVLVANEAGDELVARASNGLPEEITLGLRIRAGEGISGQVMASRRPLVVDDLSTINGVSPSLRQSGVRSVVSVPIMFGERLLGVLYAGSFVFGHFGQIDAELLEMMAERLAGALERVSAFETERAAHAQAERDADHLARLLSITSLMATATTTEEIAVALTDSLGTDALGANVAWSNVWLVEGGRLILVPTPNGAGLSESLMNIGLDEDRPIALAVAEKRPWYTEDGGYPLVMDSGRRLQASWAILPLVFRQECAGVLVVAHRGSHVFGPDERRFLRAVAEQARRPSSGPACTRSRWRWPRRRPSSLGRPGPSPRVRTSPTPCAGWRRWPCPGSETSA